MAAVSRSLVMPVRASLGSEQARSAAAAPSKCVPCTQQTHLRKRALSVCTLSALASLARQREAAIYLIRVGVSRNGRVPQ